MALAGAVALLGGAGALWGCGGGGSTPSQSGDQQADTVSAGGDGGSGQEGPGVSGVASQDTLTPAERAIVAHRRASRGPEQPIPFSHRFHVSELQLGCEYCHTDGRTTQVASMPALSICMGCHRTVGRDLPPIGEFQTAWDEGEPVAWERVYKVPEYVQFKHQPHLRNEIACQECHGPVEEMDRVYKAASLSMGWCLSCHRQQPQDSDVATDVQLVRDAHVPDAPEGRQPVGLYPRTISSGYADHRAPDDCATCHY